MTEVINLLALDVGEKRVGLAVANSLARLPGPLPTLDRTSPSFWQQLKALIDRENIQMVVIGLPRGLDSQETEQTRRTRNFAAEITKSFKIPVAMQDEALTSWQAEKELNGRKQPYIKGSVDALAAVFILEDYLNQQAGAKKHG